LIKKVVLILTFVVCSYGQTQDSSYLTKQKIEIKELKKELNSFYNKKEKEYQTRKKELETILAQVQREKNNVQELHDKNLKILQDIQQTVQSKTTKIYNSMKPKIAAGIFDVMISEGKLEDVFDIILKLKERNVTLLMKFLSVQNAAKITEMLENYNINEK